MALFNLQALPGMANPCDCSTQISLVNLASRNAVIMSICSTSKLYLAAIVNRTLQIITFITLEKVSSYSMLSNWRKPLTIHLALNLKISPCGPSFFLKTYLPVRMRAFLGGLSRIPCFICLDRFYFFQHGLHPFVGFLEVLGLMMIGGFSSEGTRCKTSRFFTIS